MSNQPYDFRAQDPKNGLRHEADGYWTPKEAVYKLIHSGLESFAQADSIWEPACGTGSIVEALRSRGYKNIYATDLYDWGYLKDFKPVDFLESRSRADIIVTNPPYSLCVEFLEHALRQANERVYFLLRLQYLEGVERSRIHEQYRLRVHIFRRRLPFMVRGKLRRMIPYAWFCYDLTESPRIEVDYLD